MTRGGRRLAAREKRSPGGRCGLENWERSRAYNVVGNGFVEIKVDTMNFFVKLLY